MKDAQAVRVTGNEYRTQLTCSISDLPACLDSALLWLPQATAILSQLLVLQAALNQDLEPDGKTREPVWIERDGFHGGSVDPQSEQANNSRICNTRNPERAVVDVLTSP